MLRDRGRGRGFTLLEVSIASVVMVIVLLGSLKLLGDSTSLGFGTKSTYAALNDARSLVEKIKDTPFSSIQTTNWNSVAASMGLNTLPNEQLQVQIQQISAQLLSIQVKVLWNDGLRQRQIQIATQRASGEG